MGPLGCKSLWYQFTSCEQANSIPHTLTLGDYEGKEVIIDGRNRLKACEMAGVEPKFQKINGRDQKAYIFSVNINRRSMTAAQLAMATTTDFSSRLTIGRVIVEQIQGGVDLSDVFLWFG